MRYYSLCYYYISKAPECQAERAFFKPLRTALRTEVNNAPTAPVSRVLFTTIIYLGYALPRTSMPPSGAAEQTYAPICGVAPDRVYMAAQSPVRR